MQQDDPTLPWDLGAYLKTSKRARHGQKRHSKTRKQGCCPPHKQRSCTDLAATFAPGPQTLILPHEISEATGPCRASLLLLVCLCWAWCFFGGCFVGSCLDEWRGVRFNLPPPPPHLFLPHPTQIQPQAPSIVGNKSATSLHTRCSGVSCGRGGMRAPKKEVRGLCIEERGKDRKGGYQALRKSKRRSSPLPSFLCFLP